MSLGNVTNTAAAVPLSTRSNVTAKTAAGDLTATPQEAFVGNTGADQSAGLDKQLQSFAKESTSNPAPAPKPLSWNASADVFGAATTKSGADVVASGLVNIDPACKNLDELAVKQMANNEARGDRKTELDMGTVVVSPTEVLSLNLGVTLVPNQETHKYDVSFLPELSHSICNGNETDTSVNNVQGFAIQYGTGPNSQGTFTETIPDDPKIPQEDIVSKNADGVVVKRQFRETWVMGEVKVHDDEQPTYIAERLFTKLDPRGNPVVSRDHFDSTVDPDQLADALPARPDGTKVSADDLHSGIYVQQGKESAARTMALLGDSDFSDSTPANEKTGQREIAIPIGDQFFAGPTLALGWTKSPTNNTDSWYNNRTDYTSTLNDIMADQNIAGVKMDPQVVADLQKRASEALK